MALTAHGQGGGEHFRLQEGGDLISCLGMLLLLQKGDGERVGKYKRHTPKRIIFYPILLKVGTINLKP